MRLAAVLIMSCVGVSCAQERKVALVAEPERTSTAQKGDKKRLKSVTWDLNTHKLVWVVESGEAGSNGDFAAKTSERYEITPDEAVMAVKDEKRGFTEQEAASLHRLLDTLSLYCVESVVWWDRGEGDPIDKDGRRVKKKEIPKPTNPRRSDQPEATKVRMLISLLNQPQEP